MTTNEATIETISLSNLSINPSFQIRRRLDPGTVERYRLRYKANAPMEPIKVALVDGSPMLVDGWHRVKAMDLLGITSTEAIITSATYQQAEWMAAVANTAHGLPLKSKELRLVFQKYVRTGQHMDKRGKLKSYRTIGAEIGKHHTTIAIWMRDDFPNIAADYLATDQPQGQRAPENTRKGSMTKDAIRQINSVAATMRGIKEPKERGRVIRHYEATLEKLRKAAPWTADEEDELSLQGDF